MAITFDWLVRSEWNLYSFDRSLTEHQIQWLFLVGEEKKKKKKVPFLTPMEDLIAGKAETPHILCPSIAYTSWIWFWEYLYRQSWKKDGGTKYLISVTLSDLWPWQNFKPISDQLDRMAELPVKFQESRYSGKG